MCTLCKCGSHTNQREAMMATKKKPFRKLLTPPPPDHFTRAQARDAVLAVMRERGEIPRPDPTADWTYEDGWVPTPEMFEP